MIQSTIERSRTEHFRRVNPMSAFDRMPTLAVTDILEPGNAVPHVHLRIVAVRLIAGFLPDSSVMTGKVRWYDESRLFVCGLARHGAAG